MPATVLSFDKPRTLTRRGYKRTWGWFADEAPRIGSGIRQVYVKRGRKWALVIGRHGRAKLPLATWNRLETKRV